MIYSIGIDTDNTFIYFLEKATKLGIEVKAINLRAVINDGDWRISIPDGDKPSFVSVSGEKIYLDPTSSYYNRIISLSRSQDTLETGILWYNLTYSLYAWLQYIPGVVINRPGSHVHNYSKPLHEIFLIQSGLNIPKSITTSDPALLLQFINSGPTIIKSTSSMRTYARLIESDELKDFNPLSGPIHLQRHISGEDVRAHVIGNKVYAELIKSEEVDYRRKYTNSKFSPHVMPEELMLKLIKVTREMKLSFVGWDFKLDNKGQYWCLEANPMPGYDSYDRRLGGIITNSLIELLLEKNINT